MRYPPIPESNWTPEQRAVARAIADGPRGEVRGPFVPLLHTPALAGKIQALGETIRFGTSIPDALLEIAVCMTARACECPYIWASHARMALEAGVSRDVLAAIARRDPPNVVSADEALLHAFCIELLDAGKIGDATFAATAERWGKSGAMEIAAICGYYSLLACILIAADHPLPAGTAPFSLPADARPADGASPPGATRTIVR